MSEKKRILVGDDEHASIASVSDQGQDAVQVLDDLLRLKVEVAFHLPDQVTAILRDILHGNLGDDLRQIIHGFRDDGPAGLGRG